MKKTDLKNIGFDKKLKQSETVRGWGYLFYLGVFITAILIFNITN